MEKPVEKQGLHNDKYTRSVGWYCRVLFITTYIRFEESYESYNSKAGDMLRITLDIYNGSEYLFTDCETHMLTGQICKDEFPEVIDYVRMFNLVSHWSLRSLRDHRCTAMFK